VRPRKPPSRQEPFPPADQQPVGGPASPHVRSDVRARRRGGGSLPDGREDLSSRVFLALEEPPAALGETARDPGPRERPAPAMKIGILGTRGIPARYGGFETLAEELSARLAARGPDVPVYTRPAYAEPGTREWRGAKGRARPAVATD